MANKKDNQKQLAEHRYIVHGDSFQEIADDLGVHRNTVSTWAKNENWEDRKRNLLSNPSYIQQLIHDEIVSRLQGNPPKLDADGISKLMKAANDVMRPLSIPNIFSILKECDKYIANLDIDEARIVAKWHKNFLNHKIDEANHV